MALHSILTARREGVRGVSVALPVLRQRLWVIERTFGWIGLCRKLSRGHKVADVRISHHSMPVHGCPRPFPEPHQSSARYGQAHSGRSSPAILLAVSATFRPDASSHSQTTITFQPRASRRSVARASRVVFRSNFSIQNAVLLFGIVAILQPWCRCKNSHGQKLLPYTVAKLYQACLVGRYGLA